MPAIYILIDTDPADNTTTVDCWTKDDETDAMLPIEQHWQHIANDPSGGSIARVALRHINAIFTGGQPVSFGPGVPPEVVA